MKNLIYIILAIILIGILGYIYIEKDTEQPGLAEYFQEQMVERGIAGIGHPVEGFDNNLLIMAYPGLSPEDFKGVETFEGHYELEGEDMIFVRDVSQPVTSAERTVSKEGYATLLENLSERLDFKVKSKEDVLELIEMIDTEGKKAFKDDNLGLEFSYRTSPDGYVLLNQEVSEGLAHLELLNEKEYKELEESDIAREGPPGISLMVFPNPDGLSPKEWVRDNPEVSNIDLALTEPSPFQFSGREAVRYIFDGLYMTEAVVVSGDEKMYVFTGSYLDEDSMIREDFLEMLETVNIY